MKRVRSRPSGRSTEVRIPLNVPVKIVWKALTDAQELCNWFPLEAKVKPGVRGSIWMSWGEPWVGQSEIEVWEPDRHLRLRQDTPGGEGGPLTVDYYLETEGPATVLRLVHSGFGAAPGWDDEYFEAVRRGWQFELRGLRHYLERHLGTRRHVAWARWPVSMAPAEAWLRLTRSDGLFHQGGLSGLSEGDPYRLRAPNDQEYSGVVQVYDPPHDFSGTVAGLHQALLRICVQSCGLTQPEVSVWLSVYGLPGPEVECLQQSWISFLRRLFQRDAEERSAGCT